MCEVARDLLVMLCLGITSGFIAGVVVTVYVTRIRLKVGRTQLQHIAKGITLLKLR